MSTKYFGKYKGTVLFNNDLEFRGRLILAVPDVTQLIPNTWAEPCVPLSGPPGASMGVYMVPPVGAGVWVEFEAGNPCKPIWVGCRWDKASDVPPLAHLGLPVAPNLLFQSFGKNAIVISDLPTPVGGIMIKSGIANASIIVNDTGIYIQNGKGASINLVGNAVLVNGGALTVV
jgi:hypothetical protein